MQDELITATERAHICVTHVLGKQKKNREMKECHGILFCLFFFSAWPHWGHGLSLNRPQAKKDFYI